MMQAIAHGMLIGVGFLAAVVWIASILETIFHWRKR